MFRFTRIARVGLPAALVLVGLWWGCAGDRPVAPSASPREVAPGFAAQHDRLARLARRVALALRDPEVRGRLYQAIRQSPYREQKLHLRTFLQGPGRGLLSAMTALEAGLTDVALLTGLDSLTDLELYLPVEAHRARWAGDERVLVAAALQDGETPLGYDLDGRAVRLSAERPPETPTLALVPVETDFAVLPARAECLVDCDGGGEGGGDGGLPPPDLDASTANLSMVWSYVADDHEGWLMGNPEFEVHAIGHRTATDTTVSDLQCAGEGALGTGQPGIRSIAYVYNQDAATWSGQVRLLSYDQITRAQQNPDSSIVLWMWEDDHTPCTIKRSASSLTSYLFRLAGILWSHKNAVRPIIRRDWREIRPDSLIRVVIDIIAAFQNDDIVGILVDQGEAGTSYTDATHVILHVRDDGTREVKGRVRLAFTQ